jgi:site-specific DNA-methyltransferase (adenine-specific)
VSALPAYLIDRVTHADCLDVLNGLPDGSVPLIVADPPYGVGYHSNYYRRGNPHAPITNDWNFQIVPFLQEAARVLAEGGALYLFCRWDVSPLWLPHIACAGLKVKTKIVWVKDNWTAGDLQGCFGSQYEEILFAVKGAHKLRGHRYPNVWQFPRVPPSRLLCPGQKPVELLERAIEASSDRGDVVLDPFCGSGSTGEAAANAGRRYILADVDPRMVRTARLRLGLPAESAPGEQPAAPPPWEPLPADPADWGVHPEELAAIWAMVQSNIRQLSMIATRAAPGVPGRGG